MTIVDDSQISAAADQDRAPPKLSFIEQLDTVLEELGEYLNPILVKEARQAMKSRQFSVTFTLLLVCGWLWSIVGIAILMPSVYYAPSGMFMLIGYYFILAAPLLLVVPFSAYRSLASEREDGTYELLSISTLNSRQIVTGKLGSAVLQMLVYYSALAPCIAFTYLLRGLDIISVLLLLAYTFGISLVLCAVGLVFAGLARSRHWHTLISVILILALAGAAWAWAAMVVVIATEGPENIPMDEPLFWASQFAVFTFMATYIVILILVAAAQNSFPSDNRSTRIRVALLVQLALLAGWLTYGWMEIGEWPMLLAAMIFATIHWIVYGVLMTAENAKLSPRVRRQLPMSFLGRACLTWFNPGSGTGYVFAVTNMGVLLALLLLADLVHSQFGIPDASTGNFRMRFLMGSLMIFGYYVAYLGFGRLVILMIPRREQYGFVLPTLLHVLIALAGAAIPFFGQAWYSKFRDFDYTPWQATNWMWTLNEVIDHGNLDGVVASVVLTSAVVIFALNLLLTVREVEATRVSLPARVQEELDAQSNR